MRVRKSPGRWLGCGAVLCVLGLWAAACSSGGGGDGGVDPPADGEDGADGGDQLPPRQLTFGSVQVVDDEKAGAQMDLAATPDGSFAVAYFREVATIGLCETPTEGGPAVDVLQNMARYASLQGESWTVEDIVTMETTSLYGIQLEFVSGAPRVAYLGGAEGLQVCGSTDLMLASRSGGGAWSETVVTALANEAPAGDYCPKGQGMCDFGDVVGMWPSMAVAPDGTLGIAYRDIGNGYEKESADSADLEWAFSSGGGYQHEWIDLGLGAGLYTSMAFDAQSQPAVATYTGKYGAILFAHRDPAAAPPFRAYQACATTADCEPGRGLVCIDTHYCFQAIHQPQGTLTPRGLSLAIAPQDGRFLVAFFDPDQKNLMLAHSTDGVTWTKGRIATNGSTGMSPSLVIDPVTQMPGVAFYRCSDYDPDRLVCDPGQDGVFYQHFQGVYPSELTQQNKWRRIEVSSDADALDGAAVSAAVLPDGTVGVAYSYTFTDPVSHEAQSVLMFKRGTWE